jgi:hypothetical protein
LGRQAGIDPAAREILLADGGLAAPPPDGTLRPAKVLQAELLTTGATPAP